MVLHNCLYIIIAMSIKANGNVARKCVFLFNVIKTRAAYSEWSTIGRILIDQSNSITLNQHDYN